MKKMDLVNYISQHVEVTKKDIEKILSILGDSIVESLQSGEAFRFLNLGSFAVRERKATTGRNPKTGESIQIKACKVVSYKPSRHMKETINQ